MERRHAARRGLLVSALPVLAALSLAGCGTGTPTGDIVETVPARGTLRYRGEPLAWHRITVMPEGDRPAVGVANESGEFVLGTNDKEDGAVVGTHSVAVSYVGPPNENPGEGVMEFTPPPPPKAKIDNKYGNPETSGLTVQIPEGGTDSLTIDLQ